MLTVFGAIAELEREYILQRQREGIEIAKKQGKYKGRPSADHDISKETIKKWQSGKITAAKAIKELGVSKSTFYRWIKLLPKTEKNL